MTLMARMRKNAERGMAKVDLRNGMHKPVPSHFLSGRAMPQAAARSLNAKTRKEENAKKFHRTSLHFFWAFLLSRFRVPVFVSCRTTCRGCDAIFVAQNLRHATRK